MFLKQNRTKHLNQDGTGACGIPSHELQLMIESFNWRLQWIPSFWWVLCASEDLTAPHMCNRDDSSYHSVVRIKNKILLKDYCDSESAHGPRFSEATESMSRHDTIYNRKWLYYPKTFRYVFNDVMNIYISKYMWMIFFPLKIIISVL